MNIRFSHLKTKCLSNQTVISFQPIKLSNSYLFFFVYNVTPQLASVYNAFSRFIKSFPADGIDVAMPNVMFRANDHHINLETLLQTFPSVEQLFYLIGCYAYKLSFILAFICNVILGNYYLRKQNTLRSINTNFCTSIHHVEELFIIIVISIIIIIIVINILVVVQKQNENFTVKCSIPSVIETSIALTDSLM